MSLRIIRIFILSSPSSRNSSPTRRKTRAKKTLELLSQYPKGKLDAIHVACWDQPAIGIVRALEETGRDKDVKVTAIDAGPETLEIMAEPGSPFSG